MKAYDGKQEYIFISYAHKDVKTVLPILQKMQAAGFRLWYDAGIPQADPSYTKSIEDHLEGCSVVIVLMSERVVESEFCRMEAEYAQRAKKQIYVIYLEETRLRNGFGLILGGRQSAFLFQAEDREVFWENVFSAPVLQICRGLPEEAPAEEQVPPPKKPAAKKPAARSVPPTPPVKKPPLLDFGFPDPSLCLPTELLSEADPFDADALTEKLELQKQTIAETLSGFGVRLRGIGYTRGPTVTRYEVTPAGGQSARMIRNLEDDLALFLGTAGIRLEPVIPGKAAFGIEVPNGTRETVSLRSLVESEAFCAGKEMLPVCLGVDVTGSPTVFDLAKMPHMVVAGSTGTGKSVFFHALLLSLMYRKTPEELKFLLIDPKRVSFSAYRDMPHLYAPIVSDPRRAAGALCAVISEMENRFELIERVGARDVVGYRKIVAGDPEMPKMPYIVIVIDELADLMRAASDDVETAIMRIAQKARAAGIHLVLGTQRPSVDVLTGVIRANVPSRIAFQVCTQVDSRTILDRSGAEKLCGRGDLLFLPVGASTPLRVQGCYVGEDEVERVVAHLKEEYPSHDYDAQILADMDLEIERLPKKNPKKTSESDDPDDIPMPFFLTSKPLYFDAEDEKDPKYEEAVELVVQMGKCSTSLLQRRLEVGYARACRIIDALEQNEIVAPADGNKPREVLITAEEYEVMKRAERGEIIDSASAQAALVAACDEDPKLGEAVALAVEEGKCSTSLLQRRLEVGYGRSAALMDRMEELGVLAPPDGNKPRKVLITAEEYEEMKRAARDGITECTSAQAAMITACDEDPKLEEAAALAVEEGKCSSSLLQRHLRIGYGRSVALIDRMEELGILDKADENNSHATLMNAEQYNIWKDQYFGTADGQN